MDKNIIKETNKQLKDNVKIFSGSINILKDELQNCFDNKLPNCQIPLSQHPFTKDIEYKENSYGYRSDEFTNIHNGKHILFSGCSVTQGIGLNEDEIWTSQLYKLIQQKEQTSGYFNLACSGLNSIENIRNIYQYIDNFGKPDYIFLNLPEPTRFYLVDQHKQKIFCANFLDEEFIMEKFAEEDRWNLKDTIRFITYQFLNMFEKYCETNNIYLSYVTWSVEPFLSETNLKYLYRYTPKELAEDLADFIENNKQNKYKIKARDGVHQGVAYHNAWAKMLYKQYEIEKIKNEQQQK